MLAYGTQAFYFLNNNKSRGATPLGDNAILATGAYLPLLRFDRTAAAKALRWSGLGGGQKGRRAVAAHDEDALTMAVEAARLATADAPAPGTIIFGSTSAPFTERAHGTLVGEALNLSPDIRSLDVAGCRRAGFAALLDRLGQSGRTSLVTTGERRPVKPGSSQELGWGDGAAAALVGPGEGLARLLGQASINRDLVDVYASAGRPAPYAAEERWVRDIAVAEILAPAIRTALAEAGVKPGDVTLAAVPDPVSGTYKAAAAACGLKAPNVCADIQAAAGDLGAALPLFGLALALERAAPGDVVLVAGFGSGCDVGVFRVTANPARPSAGPALAEGHGFDEYVRLLSLEGAVDLDWGPRSEADPKVPASVLWRGARAMHGFIGGICRKTGVVQFPKSRISVSPGSHEIDTQDDIRLVEVPARVVSITADRLNFSPDPPFHFGLIQFENGARVMMEMVDTGRTTPAVGDAMRMRFRIKAADRKRGFRTYFWKAAPLARPHLEA